MMSRPKLILLDEPSMGLAPQVVEEIFEIVRGLNEREGVSFLLAEQNTNIALRYASFGYILETGRVVLDGAAEALERPTRTCANSISVSPARTGARSRTSRPTSGASAGWRESEDDNESRTRASGACATGSARFMGGATRSPARSATSRSATSADRPTSR